MSTLSVTNLKHESASGNNIVLASDGTAAFAEIITASKGLKFPATAVASADPNTLDDYEEGTWTPSLGGSTGSAGSYAASINIGRYVKIGRFVFVSGYIALTNKGSWTGVARITGLPFTVNNDDGSYSFGSSYYANATLTANTYGINGYPQINTTRIQLTRNGATVSDSLTVAEINNNTQIGAFGFCYYATA